MPARIPRGLLALSLLVALLQGCAAAPASHGSAIAPIVHPPAVAALRDVSHRRPLDSRSEGSPRSGYHFSLGIGAGRGDLTCEGCIFDSKTGYSAFLAVARSVASNTLLGIEASGWTKDETRIYGVTAQLTQYLNRNSGLFLSAGLGWTGFRSDGGPEDVSGSGLGLSSRLGYELGMGRVSVVPYVGYLRGLGTGGARLGDITTPDDVITHSLQVGVGLAVP
jgi:hypothetical protein